MNEEDLKKYIDDSVQEHLHNGGGSKKLYFGDLKEVPDFVYNPLTKDLSLNGYKLTGGTLISGQTEVTSIEATDEFLVSDASDSGNLKKIDRQYFGDYVTSSGGSAIYTSSTFTTETFFTVLFSGTVTLAVTGTGPTAAFRFQYYLPGEQLNTTGHDVLDTSGASVDLGINTNSAGVYVYAGTRIRAYIYTGSGSNMQATVAYTKALKTIPYAS